MFCVKNHNLNSKFLGLGYSLSKFSMKLQSSRLRRFLDKWPGKKYLGIYRFLPIFFTLGAALEFSMINWKVGEVNFYRTFKKRQAKEYVESIVEKEKC